MMTDLLASLVDRALDRVSVLQRRQPTLFEPVAEAVFGKRPQFDNESSLQEEEIVAVHESGPSARRDRSIDYSLQFPGPLLSAESQFSDAQAQPIRRRKTLHPGPLPEDKPEANLQRLVAPATIKSVPKARDEHSANEAMRHSIAKPEAITIAPQRLIETIVERKVEREVVAEHLETTRNIGETHSFVPPARIPKESTQANDKEGKQPQKSESRSVVTPKEPAVIKPRTQKKAIAPRGPSPVRRAVSPSDLTSVLKQPAAPIIHVTIGRVEVRATAPASEPAKKAHPAGPRLGLEDYLRSRSKGN
jgi:hypothetical protein